jgi:hypothetical protein
MRLIARSPLWAWIGLSLAITMLALVLVDLPAELVVWNGMRAANVPFWVIIGGYCIAWVRRSMFWSCMILAGFGSAVIWFQAKKEEEQKNRRNRF